MYTKDYRAEVKAMGEADGLDEGEVRMLVSVFGNVDRYGDSVMPGAFAESLAEWKASGNPIPFIWSHKWDDPFAHIGYVTEATETDGGLEVTAKVDLDIGMGKQVYGLLKQRRITQASFAYDVLDHAWVEREADDGAKYHVLELRKLSLIECGPCLVGVNSETELLEVKAHQLAQAVKNGQSLSGQRSLLKAFDELADALHDSPAAGGEQTSGTSPDDAAAHPGSGNKSAQTRARLSLIELMEGTHA